MKERDEEGRDVPDVPLTPREQEIQRLLREAPDPVPEEAFRNRLRNDFTQGRVQAPPGIARSSQLLPRPVRVWRALRIAVPALAAAILLLFMANRGPRWQVLDPLAGSTLVVDGKIAGVRDAMARLHAGSRIESRDSTLVTLVSPGNLVVQILPGTEVVLPAPPNRWFGRESRASITTGEIRVTTDHGFHGARLWIDTPEVEVGVVGTTVAVIRPAFGTCVCVLEGTVHVALRGDASADSAAGVPVPRVDAPEAVSAGHRFTFFRAEGRIDRGEMLPEERLRLGTLQSLCAPMQGHRHSM